MGTGVVTILGLALPAQLLQDPAWLAIALSRSRYVFTSDALESATRIDFPLAESKSLGGEVLAQRPLGRWNMVSTHSSEIALQSKTQRQLTSIHYVPTNHDGLTPLSSLQCNQSSPNQGKSDTASIAQLGVQKPAV